MDKIEPAIGDVVEIDSERYVCKVQNESKSCQGCALLERSCGSIRCKALYRQDGMNVYFTLATGENAEQKANAMKEEGNAMEEEQHKNRVVVLSAIREEVITKAAVEVKKARNDIEEENQNILNYLRDFLLRHNSRITEVKVATEPLRPGLGVQVPADRIIIELKQGTQEWQ